jgi:ABC-type multidrug transport system permease subunit
MLSDYYRNETAIILFISSLQTILISSFLIKKLPTTDLKYNWAVGAISSSGVSIVLGIIALFGYQVPYLYDVWLLISVYMNLIIAVLGIVVFPSSSVLGTIGWVVVIVLTVVLNAFTSNALLPEGPSAYKHNLLR